MGPDIQRRALQVLLGLAVVESFVHYTDNTLRFDDYMADHPSFPGSIIEQWVIPVSWVLFTVTAVLGYRAFRDGRRAQGAAWLAVYSVSGLVSIGHFKDISPSELSLFQNVFVFADIALGVLILAFAVWTALSTAPQRAPAT
jgi:hypothetical protein